MKKCKCGCGQDIKILDSRGRERFYSKGHNPKPWLLGRKLSEESRKKISNAHMGMKHTEKTKKRLSSLLSGSNHWAWKGGISDENKILRSKSKYKEWRLAVYKRDNFTCVSCGAKNVYVNADHIKSWAEYPDLRYDIENGRTLCVPCHRKTDNFGWSAYWQKQKADQLKKGIESCLK